MEKITIETGEREYSLNDRCTVRFNPADPQFADRLYTAFDELRARQDERDAAAEKMTARERFDYLRKLDAEMRETIDGVFEQPVCAALFPNISVYAAAGGCPVWLNFVLAIMNELEESVKREKELHSGKLAKYTKKYHL